MKRQLKDLYLKVIREGTIIFVSVLFALFIDNWNSERKDERTEKEYISRVIKDLKSDSVSLYNTRAELNGSMNDLQVVINNENPPRHVLAKNYNNILNVSTFKLHDDTYEVLKYNGGFNLIRNSDILFQIVEYYSETTFLDASNSDQIRVFSEYTNLLKQSGFVVADSANVDEIQKLLSKSDSRGLLALRKVYASVLLSEIERRQESAHQLIQSLTKYEDE
jgi:hypothetical protein